jgi:hypothetical protein
VVLQNSKAFVDSSLKLKSDNAGNGQLEFGACSKQFPTKGAANSEHGPIKTEGLEQLSQRFR